MGARTAGRAFGPGMALAIVATTVAAAIPAIATAHGKDPKGQKEPDAVVIWFNSVVRPKGVPIDRPVTICVTRQVISWREGNKARSLAVPDARIQFKPWETQSWTVYGGGLWDTSVPSAQGARETFMSGASLPLPDGIPRDVSKLAWTATFASDTPGVSVQWKWGAAAYTMFTDDYDALDVAPVDEKHGDNAGTPVAFKRFVVHGNDDDDDDDNGDGGSRFTGPRGASAKASAPQVGFGCGGAF